MPSGSPLPSGSGDDTGFVTSPSSTAALASASLSSDLDAFEPGRDRVRRAPRLADRVRSRVTAGVDEGPLILQGSVPVADSDDPDTLAARVLGVEHRLLPQAVRWFADGRLTLRDGRAWLDERPALEHARLENF